MGNKFRRKKDIVDADFIDLRTADNSVGLFTLAGECMNCKVVDVYDGDTCKIVVKLKGVGMVKFNCRMAGYDTPEMRPPRDKENRDEEIAAAKKAKERLIELVMKPNQVIVCRCGEFDKYGRLLVELFLDVTKVGEDKSVNKMMIAEGHGYAYDGGTKRNF